MVNKSGARLLLFCVTAFALGALRAEAQFASRQSDDLATGEQFHIEASAGIWSPSTQMTISSEALGIVGSDIDFKKDLGLTDQNFKELHVVLRPVRRHKLRFQYIPITFEQSTTLTREVVFQGLRYRVGLPVNSRLDWKAYRFAYEFDFLTGDRYFAGLIIDAKYTDVLAQLQSPVNNESVHARAPIPAIGGIGRYYLLPNVSVTGELTGFKLPGLKDYKAHYVDLDIYGTLNFTNNVGVQGGYRTFDVGYAVRDNDVTTDDGSFVLKGLYFGGVVRY